MRPLSIEPDDLPDEDLPAVSDPNREGAKVGRKSFVRGLVVGVALGVVLGAGLAVLGGLLAVGWMIEAGEIPDTMAMPGAEVPEAALELLRERRILTEGEVLLYFYSGGFLSYAEDGNLFTDQKVVSYWEDDDGVFQLQGAAYPEVVDMEVEYEEGYLDDSTIRVRTEDDEEIVLYVCNELGRDVEFYELLRATWEAGR